MVSWPSFISTKEQFLHVAEYSVMKYGKYLEEAMVPEWKDQYVAYKKLKKLLKPFRKRDSSSNEKQLLSDSDEKEAPEPAKPSKSVLIQSPVNPELDQIFKIPLGHSSLNSSPEEIKILDSSPPLNIYGLVEDLVPDVSCCWILADLI